MKVVILVAEGVQDEEFIYPYYRLQEEFEVDVAVSKKDFGSTIKGKYGVPIKGVNKTFDELNADDYVAVIIPGGWQCPEKLRMDEDVLRFVRDMNQTGKVISAICHGPQVLISAGIIQKIWVSGYIGIKDDIINAGASYSNVAVATIYDIAQNHAHIVTAPHYKDNPDWMKLTLETIKRVSK